MLSIRPEGLALLLLSVRSEAYRCSAAGESLTRHPKMGAVR